MDFIRDGVVEPFRHVATHIFRRSHADNLVSVGLPERAVFGRPCLRQFHDFVQALLVEIGRTQTYSVCLNRGACIRVGQRSQISSRAAPAITVLPEVRELGLLSPNTEDRGFGAEPPPALSPQPAKLT